MAVSEKHRVRFGPFEVDLHSGELFRDGVRLKLQPQPIQVLSILLENPGELITRDDLRKRLWPEDTFVDFEQGLNTAIKKLRQALGDEAETPRYIETLPKRGYRFIAEVVTVSQPATAPPRVRASPATTERDGLGTGPASPPRRPPLFNIAIMFLVTIGVLASSITLTYHEFSPMTPRIVGTRQLTHTRFVKTRNIYESLATDGVRVYFLEHRDRDQWVLAQVSTVGGEVSDIPTPLQGAPHLRGISPSGAELMMAGTRFGPDWILPLPVGPLRQVPIADRKNAGFWTAWAPDGTIIFSADSDHRMFRVHTDGSGRTFLFWAPDITGPRVSPDGTRIRFASCPNGCCCSLWEAGIDGKNPHAIFPDFKSVTAGDWISNGKLFFFGSEGQLWVVRERTSRFAFGRPKPSLLYAGPLEISSPVSSRDGKELYVVGADRRGELNIYDPQSAKFVPFLGGISAGYATYSPDRQWVAYVSYPDLVLWKSRNDGTKRMQLTFPPAQVQNPRWSPDGKFIAYTDINAAREHHAIYIVPAEGGQASLLLSGPSGPTDPTWSPDSRFIAYAKDPGPNETLPSAVEILNLETMQSTKVPGSDGMYSPRWSPDGRHLAAIKIANYELVLYDFEHENWRPVNAGTGLGWPAWSHDSRFVYVKGRGTSNITRVNIDTGRLEVAANLEGVRATDPAWHNSVSFNLTPDDRIMILRDTGTEEIYALQLEY